MDFFFHSLFSYDLPYSTKRYLKLNMIFFFELFKIVKRFYFNWLLQYIIWEREKTDVPKEMNKKVLKLIGMSFTADLCKSSTSVCLISLIIELALFSFLLKQFSF